MQLCNRERERETEKRKKEAKQKAGKESERHGGVWGSVRNIRLI